ncbi:MAG: 2OG-Fe(II) oxygenase [Acetobacteraceae bacterium]|nr:2OG-Fe(II) oxygenase [Acetobacteraceae bacterium]
MQFDLHALQSAPINPDPFDHVVVANFIPPDTLAQVVGDLPPIAKGGSFPPDSLRLGPAARALACDLEGPAMRHAIADRFGLDLDAAPTMLTLRGRTREKDGRIHCDSTAKRVTVLIYLNPATSAFADHQGCLRLLRGPDDLEDFAVEVPPVNGTLLAFPNGPTAWHGHPSFVGQRYSIQLNYMATDQAARSELRRHRLSALVKRFARAA